MRMKRISQMSIYEIFAKHKIADELIKISNWLDAHPETLDWVESEHPMKRSESHRSLRYDDRVYFKIRIFVEILAMNLRRTGFSFNGFGS